MFENSFCFGCRNTLGFLPDRFEMTPIRQDGDVWRACDGGDELYRMCQNYSHEQSCNWMLQAHEDHTLCLACRLNRTVPDLSIAANRERWQRLETAKRRLVFNLLGTGLSVEGLMFDFLMPTPERSVTSGYSQGVITINALEADDDEREKMRVSLGEPYRTLLGHFRHESGHFYWERLILPDSQRLEEFRQIFGDERDDYSAALQRHYQGGVLDWSERGYISSYASSHPWEDWAECWAHYLHIVATTETAREFSMVRSHPQGSWQELLEEWVRLTFVLNSINRSMGVADLYPFVVSEVASRKLEWIHALVRRAR